MNSTFFYDPFRFYNYNDFQINPKYSNFYYNGPDFYAEFMELKNENKKLKMELTKIKEDYRKCKETVQYLEKENNEIKNKSSRSVINDTSMVNNGIVALINKGNFCFINAFLQITKTIFPLVKYITLNSFEKCKSNLVKSYQQILFNLLSNKKFSVCSPEKFKMAISQINSDYSNNEQNDSTNLMIDFISHITKDLHDEYNNYNSYPNIKLDYNNDYSIDKKFFDKVKNLYNKRNNILTSFFYFIIKSTEICTNCKEKKITFSYDNYINCSIIKNKSLKDCIKNYQAKNEFEITCEFCQKKCKIEKTNEIYTLPKVLFINLKRIKDKWLLQNEIKYKTKLDMGKLIKNKNYKNYEYDLTGIIFHQKIGNMGHKYAYIKNIFNNKWYLCNDSIIQEKREEDIYDESHAFLFVYQIDERNNYYLQKIAEKSNKFSKI